MDSAHLHRNCIALYCMYTLLQLSTPKVSCYSVLSYYHHIPTQNFYLIVVNVSSFNDSICPLLIIIIHYFVTVLQYTK